MDRRSWTLDDLDELRARFPVEKTAEIAASMGRTTGATARRASLLGLEKSDGRYQRLHLHYSVNQQAFGSLNPSTAYALGLILADGSISGDRVKVTNNCLGAVQAVRSALGSNHPIRVPPAARDKSFSLIIRNAELADGLRRWGITENKSLIGIWPPGLPGRLFAAVLRGYFDGDGYARYGYRSGLCLKFTSGSPGLLRSLAGELHTRGLLLRPVTHDKGRPNANRLWYYGRAAGYIGKIMYAGGGFFITRKRQPFLDYAARYHTGTSVVP